MPLPSWHPYKDFPPVMDFEQRLWSPAEITTMWWPDASLPNSTGAELRDASGNGRHAVQATPGYQPTKTGSYLTFDGTDDYLVAPAFTISQATSLFVVARPYTVAGDRTLINQQYGDVLRAWQQYIGSTGRLIEWRGGAYTTAGTIIANTFFQVAEIQSTTSAVSMWANGVLGTSGNSLTGYPYDTAIHIGKAQAQGALGWFDGDFCEAILIAGDVGATMRQQIEGYLAHKWDKLLGVTTLVTALPATHPYKRRPPVIERPLNYFTSMNLEGR